MLSRERVFETIAHREPDRVPLYCWLFHLEQFPEIERRFGSVRGFYDRLHLDMVQTYPEFPILPPKSPSQGGHADNASRTIYGEVYTLEEALDAPFHDPDDPAMYATIRDDIRFHKALKGRAVFVRAQGVFEGASFMIGLQPELEATLLNPQGLARLFEKIASWTTRYIDNLVDMGADVIQASREARRWLYLLHFSHSDGSLPRGRAHGGVRFRV